MVSMSEVVVVSPKFQVVIPRDIRRHLGIEKGERIQMKAEHGHIVLSRVPAVEKLFGKFPELAKGPSIKEIRREADARLARR